MKSSVRGADRRAARDCLIVDGYNVLAAMTGQGLRAIADLEAARHDLVDRLAEYRAYVGCDVVVVFDAYRTPDCASQETRSHVRVVYTDAGETADHRIESLVYELRDAYREITVATSDFAEQQVVFGGGALRISAVELLRRFSSAARAVHQQAEQMKPRKSTVIDSIRQDVANVLEKWRRQ